MLLACASLPILCSRFTFRISLISYCNFLKMGDFDLYAKLADDFKLILWPVELLIQDDLQRYGHITGTCRGPKKLEFLISNSCLMRYMVYLLQLMIFCSNFELVPLFRPSNRNYATGLPKYTEWFFF